MQVSPKKTLQPESPLQLLLFVDERPSSRQQVQRIQSYLKQLQADYQFELQIVDVGEQPYLAEHFKLVATPALIKIHRSRSGGGKWLRWNLPLALIV